VRFLPALILLLGASSAIGAACSKADVITQPAPPDVALCQHLAAIGCSSGADSSCGVALARARFLGPVPDACLLAASTRAAVVACGPLVGCP
jgi:hypothetical protein